jgi:hypothetical protein
VQIQQVEEDDLLALDWSVDGHFIATGDSKGRLQARSPVPSDCSN